MSHLCIQTLNSRNNADLHGIMCLADRTYVLGCFVEELGPALCKNFSLREKNALNPEIINHSLCFCEGRVVRLSSY
uniref:Uncharacterized protein n=1 Tax=Arundo donax TaxID=35708 RepID=A0A0A9DKT9_ARUDO